MTRKEFAAKLDEIGVRVGGCSRALVARKDGAFEIKDHYFYPKRERWQALHEKLEAVFPDATVTTENRFRCWPKDSWYVFIVKF